MKNNIRITTRGVIFVGEKLLLIRYRDGEGEFYVCVGGGQNAGETMRENLRRECREEIGCEVEPGEMLFTREVRFNDLDGEDIVEKFGFIIVLGCRDHRAAEDRSCALAAAQFNIFFIKPCLYHRQGFFGYIGMDKYGFNSVAY